MILEISEKLVKLEMDGISGISVIPEIRVVSQAQLQIGAAPQKAENRSYFKEGPSKG